MAEQEEVRYIDIWEFREFGYLQEINRKLLHPLGLAMEWRNVPEEAWRTYLSASLGAAWNGVSVDNPPAEDQFIDAIIELLRDMRLVGAHISGVWDERSDPEGIRYEGEEYLEDMPQKALNVASMWRQRRKARVEGLRYMVQPSGLEPTAEQGSDIATMLGQAMGDELHSAIGVKASSESWIKAAQGVLNKLSEKISESDYMPEEVTAEEVHVIDLILMPESVGGVKTRLEAVNVIVDRARFYKEMADVASSALSCIAKGDIPPGHTPQEAAEMALSDLAGMLGG